MMTLTKWRKNGLPFFRHFARARIDRKKLTTDIFRVPLQQRQYSFMLVVAKETVQFIGELVLHRILNSELFSVWKNIKHDQSYAYLKFMHKTYRIFH